MPVIIYPPQLHTKDQLGGIKIFVVLDEADQQVNWRPKELNKTKTTLLSQ